MHGGTFQQKAGPRYAPAEMTVKPEMVTEVQSSMFFGIFFRTAVELMPALRKDYG